MVRSCEELGVQSSESGGKAQGQRTPRTVPSQPLTYDSSSGLSLLIALLSLCKCIRRQVRARQLRPTNWRKQPLPASRSTR